jgi:hypothetical protein
MLCETVQAVQPPCINDTPLTWETLTRLEPRLAALRVKARRVGRRLRQSGNP